MECFGYQPKVWPAEWQFKRPATSQQQNFLKAVRDNAETPQRTFAMLNRTILEAYGVFPTAINQGTAFILMDWFRFAPNSSKSAAEKAAWSHV